MSRCVAIVQARTGSSRLPNKVILPAPGGSTLLEVLLERLQRAKSLDAVCVATTELPEDDIIEQVAYLAGVDSYRGPIDDVLARYAGAARAAHANVVVRVTGDCPLVDPAVVDRLVPMAGRVCDGLVGYACTGGTYPEGLDVEVFTRSALRVANSNATSQSDREHVCPWMARHLTRWVASAPGGDHGALRVVIDQWEDYDVVWDVLERLGKFCTTDEIVQLWRDEPGLFTNSHIERNEGLRLSLEAERGV